MGGGEFARHICGAKRQAKFKKITETKTMRVSNEIMVTVSNNFKNVTPMVAKFETGFIFLIDQYK